jgi:hypothetical protein
VNTYAYANNEPTATSDPTGLRPTALRHSTQFESILRKLVPTLKQHYNATPSLHFQKSIATFHSDNFDATVFDFSRYNIFPWAAQSPSQDQLANQVRPNNATLREIAQKTPGVYAGINGTFSSADDFDPVGSVYNVDLGVERDIPTPTRQTAYIYAQKSNGWATLTGRPLQWKIGLSRKVEFSSTQQQPSLWDAPSLARINARYLVGGLLPIIINNKTYANQLDSGNSRQNPCGTPHRLDRFSVRTS